MRLGVRCQPDDLEAQRLSARMGRRDERLKCHHEPVDAAVPPKQLPVLLLEVGEVQCVHEIPCVGEHDGH